MLLAYLVQAQTIITGQIADEFKENISGAVVSIYTETGEYVSFTNSDDNGKYKLSFEDDNDSLILKVRAINTVTEELLIKNESQHINFVLKEQVFELKELIIESPPIIKRGDTISYRVDKFAKSYDRTISDVIDRLPGIEVKDNGQIFYQGEPINKYYIEGMDLLQGKYMLANNNLPFGEVLDVQILENHQPIKLLDSLVYSPNAALNIRLKNKSVYTGQIKAGAGAAPLLWDINATPMSFQKNSQWLLSYQTNNTGSNISNQLQTLSHETDLAQIQNTQKQQYLSVTKAMTPVVPSRYWLNNNAHLISVNGLRKLSNDYELKLNASYSNDYQQHEGYTQTHIFTPTDTLQLTENTRNRLFYNSVLTSAEIYKNSPNNYLRNTIEYKANWDTYHSYSTINHSLINEQQSNKSWSLSNRFKSIVKVGEQLLDINSLILFANTPQQLKVMPGQFEGILNDSLPYTTIEQSLFFNDFKSNNSVGFSKGLGRFTLLSTLGFDVERTKLNSHISINGMPLGDKELFSNDYVWNHSNIYLHTNFQYRYKKWSIGLGAPINYQTFAVNYKMSHKTDYRNNRFTIDPSLFVERELNELWKIKGSFNLTHSYGTIFQFQDAYILKNYKVLHRENQVFPEATNHDFSLRASYRNPLRALFGYIDYSRNIRTTNLIYENSILSNSSTQINAIEQENQSSSNVFGVSLSKYIYDLKTKVSLRANYGNQQSQLMIDKTLSDVSTNNTSAFFQIDVELINGVSIDYQTQFSWVENKLQYTKNNKSFEENHVVNLNISPDENHYFRISTLYAKNKLFNSTNTYLLSDLLYRYKMKKQNIDVEMLLTNIFNTSNYTTIIAGQYSYLETNYRLRPRQILFTVRFSL